MKLYSTNNSVLRVDFKDALFQSLPADRGLYMPEVIPKICEDFLQTIEDHSLPEIAFRVADSLLNESIPSSDLRGIVNDAINFPAPVIRLGDSSHVLELFHGPSLAFKDFGARFMSRVMSYYLKPGEQNLDILVATSGDTGGAVALGFLGVPNTRVTILYPKGKVSAIQQLQLTINQENIRAVEIEGTFDDCQALVKRAFSDPTLSTALRLTSANSINIARLIPQAFYYFYAYAKLKRRRSDGLVFSVPSGNFGNIAAGIIAWRMGLPVKQFLAATNVNDTVPRFLRTGAYHPRRSVKTLSSAMDVGNPSNWARVIDLFKDDQELRTMMTGYSFSDAETSEAIETVYDRFNYVACPHTAIAWMALEKWKAENASTESEGVLLSTAHPCKFPDVFPAHISRAIETPAVVDALMRKAPQLSVPVIQDYETFKKYLMGSR